MSCFQFDNLLQFCSNWDYKQVLTTFTSKLASKFISDSTFDKYVQILFKAKLHPADGFCLSGTKLSVQIWKHVWTWIWNWTWLILWVCVCDIIGISSLRQAPVIKRRPAISYQGEKPLSPPDGRKQKSNKYHKYSKGFPSQYQINTKSTNFRGLK